jgi:hypothetical protein
MENVTKMKRYGFLLTAQATLIIEAPMGGEDVEMRMDDKVIAESAHGEGGEAAVRATEDGAKGVAQAGGAGEPCR